MYQEYHERNRIAFLSKHGIGFQEAWRQDMIYIGEHMVSNPDGTISLHRNSSLVLGFGMSNGWKLISNGMLKGH